MLKSLLLGTLVLAPGIFAQTNAGQINGTVTDQQLAALVGVKVTATNLATNVQQTTITSNAGLYALPALEPGAYRVTAELTGFNRLIREPLTVETAKVMEVDLQLTSVFKESPLVI